MDANRNFQFPWPILRVVAHGMSILDVPRLELNTMEEATNFVRAYGFEPNNEADSELLWNIFDDAIGFIEKSLKDAQYPKVPAHLRERESVTDLRRLLLLASSPKPDPDRVWACAILRLMHVLIHLAHDPRMRAFDQVQQQVLGRLDQHIFVDTTTGTTFLGSKESGNAIKLLFFKKKDRKDREREIIKLLHKAESTVEEIYDRIGFRLVTETKLDAIRVIRLLMEKNIICIPNIRPGRSRNRLVDLDRFETEARKMDEVLKKSPSLSDGELEKLVKRMERRISLRQLGRSFMNPHTSEYYRAIQFTCRELIKIRNPEFGIFSRLEPHLKNLPDGGRILAEVFPGLPPEFDHVFFPYEIQIMDVRAYADSIFGRSNHEEYRRKQLDTARSRVFGRLAAAE
ncbi:MAG: TIGR04552 family protein [Deltaproteobacteria bacterium]|nr:TIGR04552 family protein [Deltaproteobacteria bacterium]